VDCLVHDTLEAYVQSNSRTKIWVSYHIKRLGGKMFEEIALAIALFSLVVLIWALSKISGLGKIISDMKSRIDIMVAPAEHCFDVKCSSSWKCIF